MAMYSLCHAHVADLSVHDTALSPWCLCPKDLPPLPGFLALQLLYTRAVHAGTPSV